MNLLSELDSPGEWFVDTKDPALTVYFWAPDQSTLEAFDGNSPVEREANPRLAGRRGVLRAPLNDGAYIGVASNVFELGKGTSYVRFEGLHLESSVGSGINCTEGGCVGVTLSGVTSSIHGRTGMQLDGTTETLVENSEAHSVGCTGIAVSGGDFNTLSPSGIVVSGNAVHQMGRWKRTYKPGIHWGGVGVILENNHIFNGPHQGILGGGNEIPAVSTMIRGNTIEDGEFRDVSLHCSAFYRIVWHCISHLIALCLCRLGFVCMLS